MLRAYARLTPPRRRQRKQSCQRAHRRRTQRGQQLGEGFRMTFTRSPCLPVSPSPCLPFSLSPLLPVSLSPCLPLSRAPDYLQPITVNYRTIALLNY